MVICSEWQIRQYTFTFLQSKDSFFTNTHVGMNGKNLSRIVTVNCFDKILYYIPSCQELAPIYQTRPETAPATMDPSVYHVALLVSSSLSSLLFTCLEI